jgi:hypothetical protein
MPCLFLQKSKMGLSCGQILLVRIDFSKHDSRINSSLGDGKIPLIALEDVGPYALWMFDHVDESAGINLEVATEEVNFQDIARIFTEVTGLKAAHKYLPLEQYLPLAEPYPNAYGNWAAGSSVPRDESNMTWRENFSAWWRFWGEGWGADRNFELLDRIHPNRVKTLAEWMQKTGYRGAGKSVLKGIADLKVKVKPESSIDPTGRGNASDLGL